MNDLTKLFRLLQLTRSQQQTGYILSGIRKSDEAIIAKIADYMECTHFKLYVQKLSKNDIALNKDKVSLLIDRVKDEKTKIITVY